MSAVDDNDVIAAQIKVTLKMVGHYDAEQSVFTGLNEGHGHSSLVSKHIIYGESDFAYDKRVGCDQTE